MPLAPVPEPGPSPTVSWPTAQRKAAFEQWLQGLASQHGLDLGSVAAANADASFRRYLRVNGSPGQSYIVMDAPPPQEDVRPFVKVAQLMADGSVPGPQVLAADEPQGFLLLSDLGRRTAMDVFKDPAATAADKDSTMRSAMGSLVRWQAGVRPDSLPPYDQALLASELALFPQWCVQREHGITWNEKQQASWKRITLLLMGDALNTPAMAVHADYMPRNLMMPADSAQALAIIDFQDAVRGPYTYDIASILRDAFISWEEEQEIDWAVRYWQAARKAGLPVPDDFGELWRKVEWMGLHRHLRVMGIFCRLKHRDGKAHYAEDLPRFYAYATKVALRYAPLKPLLDLLEPLSGASVQNGFTF